MRLLSDNSDESIPRNPVVVVRQICALLSLDKDWWVKVAVNPYPSYKTSDAVSQALMKTCGGAMRNIGYSLESIANSSWRTFLSIIVGDQSGRLTRQLVENGVLHFVLNSVKTDTGAEGAELALSVFALLFLRSRKTCALVSQYLSPTMAKTLALSKKLETLQYDTAYALHAAATASYVLYPGACSYVVPKPVRTQFSMEYKTDDFESVSKARPEDFQTAFIEPSYASLLVSSINCNDDNDPVEKNVLDVDKKRFSMIESEDSEERRTDDIWDDFGEFETPTEDQFRLISLKNAVSAYIVMENGYKRSRALELGEEVSDIEDEMDLSADEDGGLEGDDHEAEGEEEVERMNVDESQDLDQSQPSETDDVALNNLDADSSKVDVEKKRKVKKVKDAQYLSLLHPKESVVDRMQAAEGEWLLFLTLPGLGAQAESVLHRGLLKMSLKFEENEDSELIVGELTGSGWWTIDDEETLDSMKDDAMCGNGKYGEVLYDENAAIGDCAPESGGRRNKSSTAAAKKKSVSAAEKWKATHHFTLTDGSINLSDGDFGATITRPNGEVWNLVGSGIMLGFMGGIHITPASNGGGVDEDGESVAEEVEQIYGGFLLLKPESVDPSATGKSDLNAYERLSRVPLKVGPLANPDYAAYPQQWDDEDFDGDYDFNFLHQLSTVVANSSVNHMAFTQVVENDVDGSLTPFGYVPPVPIFSFDPSRELRADFGWGERRFDFYRKAYSDLVASRINIALATLSEAERDISTLSHLQPFLVKSIASYSAMDTDELREQVMAQIQPDIWREILLVHQKWVARLHLWELAGLDDPKAIGYTLSFLSLCMLTLQMGMPEGDDSDSEAE